MYQRRALKVSIIRQTVGAVERKTLLVHQTVVSSFSDREQSQISMFTVLNIQSDINS